MLIRSGMGMQLSGSVGGVVASRNRYGAYLRNRTVPVNPNTPEQLNARASFTAAALAWAGLTDLQRGAWQAYATSTPLLNRLGESITLSANAMFVRSNAYLLAVGQPLLVAAPLTPGLSTLGSEQSVSFLGPILSLVSVGCECVNGLMQYSPIVSAGVNSFGGPFSRWGNLVLTGTGGGTTQAGTRYGTWNVGERRFVRVTGADGEGKLGSPFVQALVR